MLTEYGDGPYLSPYEINGPVCVSYMQVYILDDLLPEEGVYNAYLQHQEYEQIQLRIHESAAVVAVGCCFGEYTCEREYHDAQMQEEIVFYFAHSSSMDVPSTFIAL